MESKRLRKDQHVLCKYNGDNGDLIVGRIESVRKSGDIILTNLLTGGRSVKEYKTLIALNVVVDKRYAEKVAAFGKDHDLKDTRSFAVSIVRDIDIEKSEEDRVVQVRIRVLKNKFCAQSCPYRGDSKCNLFFTPLDNFTRCPQCMAKDPGQLPLEFSATQPIEGDGKTP